ncbi:MULTISPECIES: DUF4426 domain-containing protein [Marinobacter]|jgi:hypothetical protein|uniref:DUF4426 domain-containing protein n=1 Tax=Marinobacter salarius TaxID=1420917 RepID=A0ABY1FMR4_9GAMM|nr:MULTISPECIES: DUF4426 domain-containing protein [Marinobacter]KXJ42829.1 MAG: hypothetical protein AXW11_05795 [Marinobacter sp. Hex_13]MBJ7278042.1 DUF4426 domain-containing protein [Marinobacter salarius]MBL83411.1 DUF4426 domain-containing protein [Marinobacter sp.]MBS8232334.1 DUF4426 domain-containing protein [Marinobacter salarius]MCZ4284029.1 DUF4426 domain-containing protein [Marinobacter salarius]|tara:strand:- start:33 stop:491 length:459 start_codon:yes stop_codon:yes gene_type:complete
MTTHSHNRWQALLSLACLVLLFTSQSHADSKDFGEFEVHWSVFPSTFLAPEIARENNLNRSRGIGIVNISIMRETEDGGLEPVSGQVEGKVMNDIQQARFLAFRRIQEGNAVYFIAEYQYSNAELMTFQITTRPTGARQDLPIRFTHTLFND